MIKLLAVFLCIHIVAVLAYRYNMTFDDDYYYNDDGDGDYLNERNAVLIGEGARKKVCGELLCRESVKRVLTNGKVPGHVYSIICESCFSFRTKEYLNAMDLKAISGEKDVTVFQRQHGGCYQTSTIHVKDGCLCKDWNSFKAK